MLATLLDRSDGEPVPLPPSLRERYGGELRFPQRGWVFANFVSSIDGVVSLDVPGSAQASKISHGDPNDRFMLALLRAAADAVIVGAGTLRKEGGGLWTPEHVLPECAADFAALRRAMGKRDRLLMVLVTASGDLDLRAPALAEGAPVLVLTTEAGARRLAKAPPHLDVRARDRWSAADMVAVSAQVAGGDRILTEGGPTILGQFLRERALDELFLTVAPRLVGRSQLARRLALVEGVAFAPEDARETRLVSVKTGGDYLFLRFARA